jgi:hypothetical protein
MWHDNLINVQVYKQSNIVLYSYFIDTGNLFLQAKYIMFNWYDPV